MPDDDGEPAEEDVPMVLFPSPDVLDAGAALVEDPSEVLLGGSLDVDAWDDAGALEVALLEGARVEVAVTSLLELVVESVPASTGPGQSPPFSQGSGASVHAVENRAHAAAIWMRMGAHAVRRRRHDQT